tara:strand:- start:140 stop:487 length:348 start_codon:yes stop_codon:yes gene_type:complete
MTHFAEIDNNGIVIRIIVSEQNFIDTLSNKNKWVQTSYNTIEGIHVKGGIPLRKNYAGIGYKYDKVLDMFIPPKPYNSFILNKTKGIYESSIPMPINDKVYSWDEKTLSWIEYIK